MGPKKKTASRFTSKKKPLPKMKGSGARLFYKLLKSCRYGGMGVLFGGDVNQRAFVKLKTLTQLVLHILFHKSW